MALHLSNLFSMLRWFFTILKILSYFIIGNGDRNSQQIVRKTEHHRVLFCLSWFFLLAPWSRDQ